jgi:hypothetical protein
VQDTIFLKIAVFTYKICLDRMAAVGRPSLLTVGLACRAGYCSPITVRKDRRRGDPLPPAAVTVETKASYILRQFRAH